MKLKEFISSVKLSYRLRKQPIEALKKVESCASNVVVSLTSIPTRLNKIDLTIRSLLTQSIQPNKILLWLHDDLKDKIPSALDALQGEIFTIQFTNDLTCSHRKLIYSLERFPDRPIVTCDDDLIYPSNWLAALLDEYQQHPQDIIANECRAITYQDQQPLSYKQWTTLSQVGVTGSHLLPIGYGGVLYPPNALHSDVTNSELFLQLAPKADDLWFKAMSLLQGRNVRRTSNPPQKPTPIVGSQKVSLKKTNVNKDGNRQQWLAICEHYAMTEELIFKTQK